MRAYVGPSLLLSSLVAAGAAMNGACLFDTATTTCASGRQCAPGQECAANQDACITIGGCGNNVIDDGEVCDRGDILPGDGCSADCTSDETCGNNVIDGEVGETCDDGNTNDGDGCSETCRLELCGDGFLDRANGEVCDDGNADSFDGCRNDCMSTEVCGNDEIDLHLGEECEHSGVSLPDRPPDTVDCDSDCTFPTCGDGHFNPQALTAEDILEQCDDGGDSVGCDADCTLAVCGDGYVNEVAGEDCDTGEERPNTDACNGETCTEAVCGDSIYNPEHIHPVTDSPEECDTGGDTQACDADCTVAFCGDGDTNTAHIVPDTGLPEECDDGDDSNNNGCVEGCLPASCGDGFVHDDGGTETCDDGNGVNTDDCPDGVGGTCQVATCGDGHVLADSSEQCDDGNVNNNDDCLDTCETATCGDGFLHNQGSGGEVCDTTGDVGCGSGLTCVYCAACV